MHEFVLTLPREDFIESESEQARVRALPCAEREALGRHRTFRVWGLTAFVLVNEAARLLHRKPTFATRAEPAPANANKAKTTAAQTSHSRL
jgi:hypothetical protein